MDCYPQRSCAEHDTSGSKWSADPIEEGQWSFSSGGDAIVDCILPRHKSTDLGHSPSDTLIVTQTQMKMNLVPDRLLEGEQKNQ